MCNKYNSSTIFLVLNKTVPGLYKLSNLSILTYKFNFQSGFSQHSSGHLIRISTPYHDARYPRIYYHLGTNYTGLMSYVYGSTFYALSQRSGLYYGILLCM